MTADRKLSFGGWIQPAHSTHACNCVGPQNGQPLCPCQMRGVQVINGRYVQIIDHGPVKSERAYSTSKGTAA